MGDLILVGPGERIPVDACIVTGHLGGRRIRDDRRTPAGGEEGGRHRSRRHLEPQRRAQGRTVKVGQDTTLGKVIRLVGEAEMHRPEAVRLIDRYATWFTPSILLCAAAT